MTMISNNNFDENIVTSKSSLGFWFQRVSLKQFSEAQKALLTSSIRRHEKKQLLRERSTGLTN